MKGAAIAGSKLVPLLVGGAALIALALSTFSVGEGEYVVRTRFGQLIGSAYAPGLHGCWPFERTVRIDRRVLNQRLQGESFLSADQQALVVDVNVDWRVRDPAIYAKAVSADEGLATARLADVLRAELKAQYAQQSLAQIVASPRGGISNAVMAHVKTIGAALGVEVLDARVKRIDPTDEVANAIYARMQAAYAAQTKQVRAQSSASADKIRAEADRQRAEILANANGDAQRLRGDGDAEAAAIYARAYGRNPEFAAFYRSLQAYRNALGREGDILVIEPDGEFYQYLRSSARH